MKKVCQNLNRFFDQELKLKERREFLDHLQSCPDCQKKLKFLQDLAKIGTANQAPKPADGWQFVAKNLNSSYEFGHFWWQKLAIAACFTVFSVVGSFGGNYFFEDYTSPNLNNNSVYSYLEENL